MISSLELRQFKCFRELRLPLGPLTLLTGVNAAGKSSVIQSLVLLHQTVQESELADGLLLNGRLLRLGRFGDVMDEFHGRDSFSIGLSTEGVSVRWVFQSESKDSLVAPVAERSVTADDQQLSASILDSHSFFPRLNDEAKETFTEEAAGLSDRLSKMEHLMTRLLYLSTERIGPQETYGAETGFVSEVELGSRGELTPWFLLKNGERQVHPALCLDATTTLQRQIAVRLADFFPGADLDLQPVPGTNLVTLLIRTSQAGRYHRLQNVGYGLTHVLPVLVACLAASPGQTVLIENPEAHLHPAAQAKMGEFVALVAATGVQLILESHSDHVLNGIRRAVKERVLAPDSVAIHFFQRQDLEADVRSQIISPQINSRGVIDQWPENFFDQFDRDLEALTDWA